MHMYCARRVCMRMCVYVYVYVCMCMCVCTYVYVSHIFRIELAILLQNSIQFLDPYEWKKREADILKRYISYLS